MLKNKKFQAILSLLIAIGLWVYVMGTVDPTVKATINDIPVEKINEEVLKDKGLTATLKSPEVVSIKIRGARSDISEAKKSGVKATVDVSNCEYGENEASIRIRFSEGVSGIKIEDMSERTAVFTVQ